MRRSLRLLSTAALTLGLVAPGAFAQSGPEPGVTVDSTSPSAKEYQLPIDKARKDAQGKKKSKSTQLFGAGVKSGGSGGSGTSTTAPPTATTAPSTSTTPSSPSPSSKSSSTKNHRKAHKRKSKKSSSGEDRTTTAAAAPTSSSNTPKRDVAPVSANAGDSSSLGGLGPALMVAVGGLGVLLLGGLTGLVLRRRMRPDA
jgi:hypothetical protein